MGIEGLEHSVSQRDEAEQAVAGDLEPVFLSVSASWIVNGSWTARLWCQPESATGWMAQTPHGRAQGAPRSEPPSSGRSYQPPFSLLF